MKLLYVSLFLCSLAFASYEEGVKVFQKKCSSCHKGYIDPKIIKRNFFQEDNNLLHLQAPTENMLAWAIMKGPKHVGEEGDDFRSVEIEEYLRSLFTNPRSVDTICEHRIAKFYGTMPPVKVSEEEMKNLVDFFMQYDEHSHTNPYQIQNVSKLKNDKLYALVHKAKVTNKSLLVEVMSDHCWYCKNMQRKVLSRNNVQSFMNKHFLFHQINIDHEEIPNRLKEYYKSITPSFFILNMQGKIVGVATGSWSQEDFIDFLKKSLNESR